MSHIVEALIEQFSDQRDHFFAKKGLVNNDIFVARYDDQNYPEFKYPPRHMYFYYVRVNTNGRLKVTHYEYKEDDPNFPHDPIKKWKEIPRTKAGLEDIVLKLAENARIDGNDPLPTGMNFKTIVWERRSYIVIFFDEKNWKLYKKPQSGSSVVFLTEKGGVKHTENHSFFDAQDLDIEFSSTDVRSAIAFINHLKGDDQGTDLKPNMGHPHPQKFQFNLFLKLEFQDGTDSPMDIIVDPGGTNQGPALQP